MLSLHTTAVLLVMCSREDLANRLALLLMQARQWSELLIWRVASSRGGRKAIDSQSAPPP
jgi:hypothetical protein